MFILDTLLLSPIYGTIWVARQVQNVIEQERGAAPEQIAAELSELYMMLETGRITEGEFDAREKEFLDQLDRIQERENPPQAAAKPRKKRTKRPSAIGRRDLVLEEAHSAI